LASIIAHLSSGSQRGNFHIPFLLFCVPHDASQLAESSLAVSRWHSPPWNQFYMYHYSTDN